MSRDALDARDTSTLRESSEVLETARTCRSDTPRGHVECLPDLHVAQSRLGVEHGEQQSGSASEACEMSSHSIAVAFFGEQVRVDGLVVLGRRGGRCSCRAPTGVRGRRSGARAGLRDEPSSPTSPRRVRDPGCGRCARPTGAMWSARRRPRPTRSGGDDARRPTPDPANRSTIAFQAATSPPRTRSTREVRDPEDASNRRSDGYCSCASCAFWASMEHRPHLVLRPTSVPGVCHAPRSKAKRLDGSMTLSVATEHATRPNCHETRRHTAVSSIRFRLRGLISCV